jgi:heat shock protein 5
MIKDSERFAERDKVIREKLEAKKTFEDYINSIKNTIDESSGIHGKLSRGDIARIEDAITD